MYAKNATVSKQVKCTIKSGDLGGKITPRLPLFLIERKCSVPHTDSTALILVRMAWLEMYMDTESTIGVIRACIDPFSTK